MNREIKFRFWNHVKNEMYNDVEIFGDKIGFNMCLGGISKIYDVMQFIGLKDKNGKDIYEGDLVEYELPEGWGLERTAVDLVEFKSENNESGIDFCGYSVPFQTSRKVIGNIFETPELLKGES